MRLNKQLSESISRGINLAIDDFDDNMYVDVQKLGNIENLSVTQDILKFKRISKLLDEKHFEKISKDDYEWMSEMHKKLKLSYDAGRDHKHLYSLVHFIYDNINKCADLNWINTSAIADMSNLFANSEFDGDISEWNTSNVTNMFAMFDNSQFNGDISKWNVSKVENMRFMFADSQFNGDISNWDVSNVKDMKYMFAFSQFTGDISNWDISKVEKFRDIFFESPIKKQNKPKFNILESIQHGINLAIDDFDDIDINVQKVGHIENKFKTQDYIEFQNLCKKLESAFVEHSIINEKDIEMLSKLSKKLGIKYKVKYDSDMPMLIYIIMMAVSYNNPDLNWLDTSNITDMHNLFYQSSFNGDISEWDVSNVTDMSYMFLQSKFNGDISNWDVSKVYNMINMFEASEFNGDISNWDVSNVRNMYSMFYLSEFNRDISKWDVSNVYDMQWMFGLSKFNKDISQWNIKNNCITQEMFKKCPIRKKYKPNNIDE